jgi:hypothetical protein
LLEDLGGNTENKWKSVAEDWFRWWHFWLSPHEQEIWRLFMGYSPNRVKMVLSHPQKATWVRRKLFSNSWKSSIEFQIVREVIFLQTQKSSYGFVLFQDKEGNSKWRYDLTFSYHISRYQEWRTFWSYFTQPEVTFNRRPSIQIEIYHFI